MPSECDTATVPVTLQDAKALFLHARAFFQARPELLDDAVFQPAAALADFEAFEQQAMSPTTAATKPSTANADTDGADGEPAATTVGMEEETKSGEPAETITTTSRVVVKTPDLPAPRSTFARLRQRIRVILEDLSAKERLCEGDAERNPYVILPVHYPKIWDLYQKALKCFWVASEVDLSSDIKDWNTKLTPKEKWFVKNVLAFFAVADGIVALNIVDNFMKEIAIPEAQFFYGFQVAMENIHNEMYSLLIDTYCESAAERDELFAGMENMAGVKAKVQWALKWMNPESATFAERLVAFAAVEGIGFSASFCCIFWLRNRGLMEGMGKANQLISRDEGMHRDFACLLYSMLDHKLPVTRVHEILREAVEVEAQFVAYALPEPMIEMNAGLMMEYVHSVADDLCFELGVPSMYNATNPFGFMEQLNIENRNNFFESRTTEYQIPDFFRSVSAMSGSDAGGRSSPFPAATGQATGSAAAAGAGTGGEGKPPLAKPWSGSPTKDKLQLSGTQASPGMLSITSSISASSPSSFAAGDRGSPFLDSALDGEIDF